MECPQRSKEQIFLIVQPRAVRPRCGARARFRCVLDKRIFLIRNVRHNDLCPLPGDGHFPSHPAEAVAGLAMSHTPAAKAEVPRVSDAESGTRLITLIPTHTFPKQECTAPPHTFLSHTHNPQARMASSRAEPNGEAIPDRHLPLGAHPVTPSVASATLGADLNPCVPNGRLRVSVGAAYMSSQENTPALPCVSQGAFPAPKPVPDRQIGIEAPPPPCVAAEATTPAGGAETGDEDTDDEMPALE